MQLVWLSNLFQTLQTNNQGRRSKRLPSFNTMTMKKSILFVALFGLLLAGCSKTDKKKIRNAEDFLLPAAMSYTANDTLKINELVGQFTEALKSQDFAVCADLLNHVKNGEIVPFSDAEKSQYVQGMSSFRHIYDVRTTGFLLRSDKNNDIKLTLQILEDGSISDGRGTINVSLNPVYKDGEWYLTLLDKNAEGVEDVYVQH